MYPIYSMDIALSVMKSRWRMPQGKCLSIGAEAFFVPSFLMISGYFLMIFFDDDFLMVKSASIKHESTKLSVYCILKVYYLNFYIICNCACLLNLVHGNSISIHFQFCATYGTPFFTNFSISTP